MVFVPTTRDALLTWRAGSEAVEAPGFAATPSMLGAHGYGPQETEDAEFAALLYAGVASLGAGPPRWVAAVETGRVEDRGSATGQVAATLRWSDVQALFVDDADGATDVARLAATVAGRPLEEVLADEAVLDAAQEHDLLWYAPTELDRIE